MKQSLILKSIADTKNLAIKIAKVCEKNNLLIFLQGDMGSGKTTLSQNIIQALDPTQKSITSPTYSFMNIYKNSHIIYHFDLYRLQSLEELYALGLEEYIDNRQAIRIIEWPNLLDFVKPDMVIELSCVKNHKIANISTIAIDI